MVDHAGDAGLLRIVQVAQIHHRFRCALCSDRLGSLASHRPHLRHRAQRRAERIGLHQPPVAVQVLGIGQEAVTEIVKGLLHRIERVDLACQNRHLHQGMEGFGQLAVSHRVQCQSILELDSTGGQMRHRHAVLSQRAGLVTAQHGGRAERLDRVDAPGEHAFLGQPTRPEGREHRQHDRVLLGQHRHRQGDAGQQGLQPVTLDQPVHEHQHQAERQRQQGQVAHQPRGLLLQRRTLVLHFAERGADAADLAARASGCHTRQRVPLNDQRAGVDHGLVVAARRNPCAVGRPRQCSQFVRKRHTFADRHGLARQQRLVRPNAVRRHEQGIGRNAVALAQLEQVAVHHVAPGDALRLAISDDQRAWAGEIAQGFDGALGLAFLIQGERHRHDHEAEQRQALLQVTKHHVQGPRREQQQEHRLAHGLDGD